MCTCVDLVQSPTTVRHVAEAAETVASTDDGAVNATVSNALLKHFYFSLSTAVKHVLADFCNVPSVRL